MTEPNPNINAPAIRRYYERCGIPNELASLLSRFTMRGYSMHMGWMTPELEQTIIDANLTPRQRLEKQLQEARDKGEIA